MLFTFALADVVPAMPAAEFAAHAERDGSLSPAAAVAETIRAIDHDAAGPPAEKTVPLLAVFPANGESVADAPAVRPSPARSGIVTAAYQGRAPPLFLLS